MPRPANPAAIAACLDPANASIPTSDLARATGIAATTLADVRARLVEAGEIPEPPSGRGHRGDRVIALRVTAAEYQRIRDAADGGDLGTWVLDAVMRAADDACGDPRYSLAGDGFE